MAPDWMNWDGWRWISLIFTACVFFYFGWDARGFRIRMRSERLYVGDGREFLVLEVKRPPREDDDVH